MRSDISWDMHGSMHQRGDGAAMGCMMTFNGLLFSSGAVCVAHGKRSILDWWLQVGITLVGMSSLLSGEGSAQVVVSQAEMLLGMGLIISSQVCSWQALLAHCMRAHRPPAMCSCALCNWLPPHRLSRVRCT